MRARLGGAKPNVELRSGSGVAIAPAIDVTGSFVSFQFMLDNGPF